MALQNPYDERLMDFEHPRADRLASAYRLLRDLKRWHYNGGSRPELDLMVE
jgi:hypothetical protein